MISVEIDGISNGAEPPEAFRRIRDSAPHVRLSRTERRIIMLVCGAASNKEIAWQAGISESHVANCLHTIYRLTGCRNRAGLVTWAHVNLLPAAEPFISPPV